MNPSSQTENQFPRIINGTIFLMDGIGISQKDAANLGKRLIELANICNVATFIPNSNLSLWDSLKDGDAFTIEVDVGTLHDIQRLAKIGDNLEKSVIELINFYEDRPILNIILLPDCLVERESYTNYTAQFGNTLTNATSHHPFVKVLFDQNTSRLGIFCRKSRLKSKSFTSQLVISLAANNGKVFIPIDHIPKQYHTNFAMMKQHLKTNYQNVEIERFEKGVKISVDIIGSV